ncbi:hypothetical protein [Sorangium sp. So ce513]|uniref:hypothetical protein n=1 Tax=Sorangium sp. So ce513 TaxID=3133315 RepID=UPI003F6402F3
MTREDTAARPAGQALSTPAHSPLDPSSEPYEFFERARQHDPVHFTPPFNVWLVSRYAAVATRRRPA